MINGYANIGGPRPIGISEEMWAWAQQFAQHKHFCHEYFGGKADKIIEQAKQLAHESTIGALQSLDLCMQVEAEFPGRLEEVLEKSAEHPSGRIIGIIQYITYLRKHG